MDWWKCPTSVEERGIAEMVDVYRGAERSHLSHHGERKLQRIRKVPSETEEMVEITDDRSILAR